jgi:uncharacterized protein YcbX
MRLTGLTVYPVKSCRGIALDCASVVERGLKDDRRWMIVDGTGRFVTQRELPELALIRTLLEGDAIVLEADGAPSLRLAESDLDAHSVEVEVWGHRGPARVHAAASTWITDRLGVAHSLVFMPDEHRRAVNPDHGGPNDIVSFADAYPFLLTTEASLDDLNERLPSPITMNRFRPNLVVAGSAAWAEDRWTRLWVGEVAFRVAKPCKRCATTTVDPETGRRGTEPLRTLATFRDFGDGVLFGVNLVHQGAGTGTLHVGDAVRAE